MKSITTIGMRSLALAALFGLGACASVQPTTQLTQTPVRYAAPVAVGSQQPVLASQPAAAKLGMIDLAATPEGDAELVKVSKRLNCVQFARSRSGINVAGNAGTWWDHAKGKYARSDIPQTGAVMVFSSTKRMRSGHVAVVRQVISNREIRIDHANWTNDGHMHLNASVVDVSPNNDWSQVRVWNTRGGSMGTRVYPIKGFVLSRSVAAADTDSVTR